MTTVGIFFILRRVRYTYTCGVYDSVGANRWIMMSQRVFYYGSSWCHIVFFPLLAGIC